VLNGTAYPSEAPKFTTGFLVLVIQSLAVCVVICFPLFVFLSYSSGHCIDFPSLIYRFCLPLWYLQTFLVQFKDVELEEEEEGRKTGWFEIQIVCPGETTYVPDDCVSSIVK
jgi:hypothetical protein